jgi:hypothetical protein
MNGFVKKGALVTYPPSYLPDPKPNVTVFQYNPETMTHTWSQPEPAGSPGIETSNPLAVRGMPGESFSFMIAMDANDDIADGAQNAALAESTGVYSRLAALELLLYPSDANTQLMGTVSAAVVASRDGNNTSATSTVPESVMPVTLFVWGPRRIVPVRVTDLTITEQLFDSDLNPTHAEAQLTLRVLTPAELVAASADNDALGSLAVVAYMYTFTGRQSLAAANQDDAAQSIIGMIPH